MREYALTIDGRGVHCKDTMVVLNPATVEVAGRAPVCSPKELDAAMAAADRAFAAWSKDEHARRECLAAAAGALEAGATEIAELLTSEQGKGLADARWEVSDACNRLRYHAELDVAGTVLRETDRYVVRTMYRPLGVAAAIVPWNFPISMAAMKIAPALLAGCTVVLKPSPYTPLSTLLLGEILRSVLPPGVLNVVSGTDELGSWMTSHPLVSKVTFTGSTATGRKVAVAAANSLRRVTLELGGNDAAIVLEDADPAQISDRVFWGAFTNNGQICIAVKRLFVHDSLFDDVVERLTALAAAVQVGDGRAPATQLGPVNNRPQYDRIGHLVADALAGGAKATVGGTPLPGPGYFYPPTILVGASIESAVVAEEQFGPALPVLRYSDLTKAIDLANATEFGLGGSVWSSDPGRAEKVAEQLVCGTAWVNTHGAVPPWQPVSGARTSGIGTENGVEGVHEYSQEQVVRVERGAR